MSLGKYVGEAGQGIQQVIEFLFLSLKLNIRYTIIQLLREIERFGTREAWEAFKKSWNFPTLLLSSLPLSKVVDNLSGSLGVNSQPPAAHCSTLQCCSARWAAATFITPSEIKQSALLPSSDHFKGNISTRRH